MPFGDGQTFLDARAMLLQDIRPSPELYRYIATNQVTFGRLELWTDETGGQNVILSYQVLGEYLDEPEFRHVVTVVAYNADNLDDELQRLFGGRRYLE